MKRPAQEKYKVTMTLTFDVPAPAQYDYNEQVYTYVYNRIPNYLKPRIRYIGLRRLVKGKR